MLLTLAGPLGGEMRSEERPRENLPAPPGPATPTSLDTVRKLIWDDRFGDAEKMARDLLLEAETTKGCESVEAAEVIDWIVKALTRGGKARDAETLELADRAISIREKAFGPDDAGLSTSLARKASLLKARGLYAEGQLLLERALALREAAFGSDDPGVGQLHNDAGALLFQIDNDASERHWREALRIFELAGGPEGIEVADALGGLANCATMKGELAEAEELYLRSLRVAEAVLRPRDPYLAVTLSNLGNLYTEIGDYEKAREQLQRALSIQEEELGPRHPELFGSLLNLAISEQHLGIPSESRFERAVAVAAEGYGPDNWRTAVAQANYAISISETDFARSRSLLEQALAVFSKTFGPLHGRVLWILGALGERALRVGDLATAELYLDRALESHEKLSNGRPQDLADATQGLAKCRAEAGRTAEARALHERALALFERSLGPEHPEVAKRLADLGDFHRRYGDPAEAEAAYSRSLTIRKKTLGEDHPEVGESLIALADVKAQLGKTREAGDLFERGFVIQKKARAPDDPRNADGYRKYASYLLRRGSPRTALPNALRAESISRRYLRSTVVALSELNALGLVRRTPTGLDLAISAASELHDPVSAKAAMDALIRSRALVLDEMGERHRATRVARDPELTRLLAEYVAARTRLANLTVAGEDEKLPAKSRKRLDEARAAKEVAERALAEKSVEFRRSRAQAGAGLAEVSRALPEASVLVAFVRYARYAAPPPSQRQPSPAPPVESYAAFLLRHDSPAPTIVPLGPADAVDAQVVAVRTSLGQMASTPGGPGGFAETTYRRSAAALEDLVWKPLEPFLGPAETVFLVPDGSLQLVSFAALPAGGNKYVVESGTVLHYLSAERDLVSPALPPGVGLIAAGAPEFDERPSEVPMQAAGATTRLLPSAAASAAFRGALPSCRSFDSMRFAALPSAGLEIEEVALAWRSSTARTRSALRPDDPGVDPLLLSGAAASEAAVKTNAPGRRVVHLATHGFFLGDCPSSPGSEAARANQPARIFADNPLLLSGLALAGANLRSVARPGADDGILTAEEIAALDLSGVEWAVLSACETGLGELRSGEGLFGLRRAFQIAGARSLILSLWAVEDAATRRWMQALYGNRLDRGMTTARAVHEASREMLLKRRAAGQSTHPFYWAGFVATGDWR